MERHERQDENDGMEQNPYKSPETISGAPPDPVKRSRLATFGRAISVVASVWAVVLSCVYWFGDVGGAAAFIVTLAVIVALSVRAAAKGV
jgi:hypothetical protein